jgi:hypothetical protein
MPEAGGRERQALDDGPLMDLAGCFRRPRRRLGLWGAALCLWGAALGFRGPMDLRGGLGLIEAALGHYGPECEMVCPRRAKPGFLV